MNSGRRVLRDRSVLMLGSVCHLLPDKRLLVTCEGSTAVAADRFICRVLLEEPFLPRRRSSNRCGQSPSVALPNGQPTLTEPHLESAEARKNPGLSRMWRIFKT